ncbi:tyrosine-type recombinase/integrase [Mucilaginibacter sp.]|uniref:tyrosine-type recombinase/integrase n=1 Tax=Mucilaginibacter sp. TaxID=1882438 RepID=UPI002639CA70|nr:tyrosine-type recombinase/integrase [Mucilaginibacter sp.]MDB4918053.1 Integrase [Mucilaginibacter sp.]
MSLEIRNYTEPTIVTNDDLKHRSYVTFYFNDEIEKQYHGKNVGQEINPNRAKSLEEKQQLLKKLQYELHKALEAKSYPVVNSRSGFSDKAKQVHSDKLPSAKKLMFEAVRAKLRTDLSRTYKRDLKSVYREFRDFMLPGETEGPINSITTIRIEKFLSRFGSSGTYYMNKRRNLGVIISAAGRLDNKDLKMVKETKRRKAKAKLHKPYDKVQLKPILEYLKAHYPNLYLCCLLTYSSWLRPHEEVRLLTLGDFKKDWTEIHLSGNGNKGGKVRVVYIPDYARKELLPVLSKLGRNDNIFSMNREPFNEFYFNTAWSRAYKKMFILGLIYEDQTIYSFRHTAAIEVYRNTKDVYLLQKMLGHSTIIVTLKYLRSLGEFNSDELRDAAPQL